MSNNQSPTSSSYFCKEDLVDKLNSNRMRIRNAQHKRMLQERRKQILNELFPLKSKTFGLFVDTQAYELRDLGDALNRQLRNERMEDLQQQQQRDLIDDLNYLLLHANFTITSPLKFCRNGDRYVCQFVSVHAMQLAPSEVDVWLEHMTIEQRKDMYTSVWADVQRQYMTTKMIACLVEDIGEVEAVELMCQYVDAGSNVHELVSMKLVKKLLQVLQQNVHHAYVHLAVGIYLRYPNEAFSMYLLDRLFMHISVDTNPSQLQRYITYINHIQQAKPSASIRTSLSSTISRIENILTEEQLQQQTPFMHNRHALKMLILCIENYRKQGKQYKLQASTISLLGRQQPNEQSRHLAEKLCSRAQIPPPLN